MSKDTDALAALLDGHGVTDVDADTLRRCVADAFSLADRLLAVWGHRRESYLAMVAYFWLGRKLMLSRFDVSYVDAIDCAARQWADMVTRDTTSAKGAPS